jgi:hypothetical protein
MRSVILALAALASSSTATVFFEDKFETGMDKWVLSNWKVG